MFFVPATQQIVLTSNIFIARTVILKYGILLGHQLMA